VYDSAPLIIGNCPCGTSLATLVANRGSCFHGAREPQQECGMAQSGTTGRRSPWIYLIGLILLIVILWYIIRGLGPEEPMPMNEDASDERPSPALMGSLAA
jgi:hypothetical protein